MTESVTTISFRALAHSDLGTVQRWLNTPQVYEWWGRQSGPGALGGASTDAATAGQVEAKYGPNIDHDGPTHRFIVEHEGTPIGLIQWYHLRDFADYARAIGEESAASAGIDFFIGEPAALGRGLGSRAVAEFVTSVVFRQKDVDRVIGGPAATNTRSIRVLAKAGFSHARFAAVEEEPHPAAIMVRIRG